jgi:hypothetical protein
MHVVNVKAIGNRWGNRWGKQWGTLVAGVLLAASLALSPASAQATTSGWWPFGGGDSALPGFWVTGEVTEVAAGSVTVELPNHEHAHGMMRFVSLQVTLEVISSTVLLDGDLAPLDLSTLEAGDELVVVPSLVWGNLVARLLYAGDPEDLADASYRGRLVAEEGDTLTLESGRHGKLTVLVDDATTWYDNGQMERPTAMAEDMTLSVLGVAEKNEEGDEVIRAVLITPGR